MPHPVKLAILEGNEALLAKMQASFSQSDTIDLCFCASNGTAAFEAILEHKPDVLLMDVILPGRDGFGIMQQLIDAKALPLVIVISALGQDVFVQKAFKMGASYFMRKPFEMEILRARLWDVVNGTHLHAAELVSIPPPVPVRPVGLSVLPGKSEARLLDERIATIFISVGIPAHIKGYQFLRDAVKLAIDTPDIINSITKKLYPAIAVRYTTSASKVERAIRHAIEVAWSRGRIDYINTLFGVKVYSKNEKPTNGEFIALLADKMLIEGLGASGA